MLDKKTHYQQFLAAFPSLPIFYQAWWLDAVCGPTNWSFALATDKAGQPAAIWPYFHRHKLWGWFKMIDKPPFSPHCGPFISPAPTGMNPANVLSRQKYLVDQLIGQLPKFHFARASTDYGFSATHPLRLAGWRTEEIISYRLRSDQQQVDALWENLAPKVRTNLRNYDKLKARIEPLQSFQPIHDLQSQLLSSRGDNNFMATQSSSANKELKLLGQLYTACQQNNSSIGWVFRDRNEQAIAVVWLPYDQQSAYLMVAASEVTTRSEDQAISQLIWHAINWCCEQKLIFDFEGSALPGVERFYRSWGPDEGRFLLLSKKRFW